jgi:hypothetical protein
MQREEYSQQTSLRFFLNIKSNNKWETNAKREVQPTNSNQIFFYIENFMMLKSGARLAYLWF